MIIEKPEGEISELNIRNLAGPNAWTETFSYFLLTVLGFSFWFFMVVPFASHRETYWWLAMVQSQRFAYAFGVISSTYRPLAQAATWLGFLMLDPRIFPTSVLRQALLQGFIYAMFVLAWWLIYSVAPQRRLFSLVAFVAGAVFFSGYVHLFHIYGIFYIPVMLTLGTLIRFQVSTAIDKRELWLAFVATLLVFWHPFATGLFVGFYFGFYLDTFRQRSRAQHVQAVAILLAGTMAIAASVVLFPRAQMPVDSRLFGFLVSYQTNEVNRIASGVAFLLAELVVLSMGLSPRLKLAAVVLVSALGAVFFLEGLPLLFLWFGAILIKLFRQRRWDLFFLALTAALLPFGGGIGTPIYVLFGIIVAVYVTPLEWSQAEKALSFLTPRYAAGAIVASTIVLLLVRAGVNVPIVTRVANPLLMERERTYQLENILAWLHNSDYCGYEIAFAENAGSPIDSVESSITRRSRPPSPIGDVRLFWKTVLQCQKPDQLGNRVETALVTFDEPAYVGLIPAYVITGAYAGDATVWISDPQK